LKVTFLLFSSLREIAGKSRIIIELPSSDVSLIEAIEELAETLGEVFRRRVFGDELELSDGIEIAVNEVRISRNEVRRYKVKSGDVIAIFPPASGG